MRVVRAVSGVSALRDLTDVLFLSLVSWWA